MRVKLLILCAWMEGYAGALKVLSFANDNDNQGDKNGEFTSAELEKENIPKSFTICVSFSTEAWSAINAQFADLPKWRHQHSSQKREKFGDIFV